MHMYSPLICVIHLGMQILVKAPCECTMGIIECGVRSEEMMHACAS